MYKVHLNETDSTFFLNAEIEELFFRTLKLHKEICRFANPNTAA